MGEPVFNLLRSKTYIFEHIILIGMLLSLSIVWPNKKFLKKCLYGLRFSAFKSRDTNTELIEFAVRDDTQIGFFQSLFVIGMEAVKNTLSGCVNMVPFAKVFLVKAFISWIKKECIWLSKIIFPTQPWWKIVSVYRWTEDHFPALHHSICHRCWAWRQLRHQPFLYVDNLFTIWRKARLG